MCGICGVCGFEDKSLIKRMNYVIRHRGPDDEGYFVDKDIMLGNRRLSIIDIKNGHQPVFNEDKSIVVVYNGEIYNFKEIKNDLEKRGHRFYTDTDTEVIVHSYEQYGDKFVNLFNGIFAFALWDAKNKKLVLARDRAGIKPLFYSSPDGNALLFGSEIKSVLQYEKIKREIDLESLHYLLNLRFIPKEKTMFKGIKKLLPGHILIYRNNKINVRKYWELRINIQDKPSDYYEKILKKTIESVIKRQMIADVPVAAYLSGGLDSSTIVAFASKFCDNLQTFCMGFGEPTDEFKDAEKIAGLFNTDHKELTVKFDIAKTMPETIWAIDTPKRNMWPYFISKEISKYVKVVLSGMGGDEVFGGYIYRYNFINEVERLRREKISKDEEINKKITEQINKGDIIDDHKLRDLYKIKYLNDNAGVYNLITLNNKLYSDEEYLRKVYGDKLLNQNLPVVKSLFEPYFKQNISFLDQTFLAEFNTKMVDDFLSVEDAASMAHSLESRVPFLDNELIDLCFNMPSNLKVQGDNGKIILKKVMKDILPKETINKKKWGFIPNTLTWYKKEFRDIALQKLPNGVLIKNNLIKKEFVMKILEHKPDEKLNMHYNFIWDLLCFEVWHKLYIENEPYKPKLDIDYLLA